MSIPAELRADGVLIITGGSRGIGAATAKLAAQRGWRVVTTYATRGDDAEAVVREIKAVGGQAVTLQADTAVEADVKRTFDTAEKHFGPVTGLVNNAGVNGGTNKLVDIPVADMRRLFDVNVIGLMMCVQEAARRMGTDRGGKGGTIVNIGSVGARLGSPGERVHYAGSKGAVISMTTGMAKELITSGIRVNCVSPGLTETEMNPPERLARLTPSIPIKRVADPIEMARTILFLLSPESSYIVGIDVTVSGGR